MITRLSRITIVLWLLVGFIAAPAHGAVTGNDWRQQSSHFQAGYVIGVADAWFELVVTQGAMAEESKSTYAALLFCMADMTRGQLVAVVEKYMKDNPDRWHLNMALLVTATFSTACTRPK